MSQTNISSWIIGICIILLIGSFAEDTGYVMVENAYIIGADGHKIILENNQSAVDPTYEELKLFLDYDKTEYIIYDYDTFVCADFAELLHNNAEAYGYSAAYVCIDDINGEGHALNAFKTTDKGLVYVDCTGSENLNGRGADDRFARVVKGEKIEYSTIHTYDNRVGYLPLGIIKKIDITW